MRAPPRHAGPQRQHRLRAIQRLNLCFFVDTQHDRTEPASARTVTMSLDPPPAPCTFLNDFARLISWSRAGRREPPTAPCVSNTWGGLVPRRSASDECPVGSLRR